MAGAAPTKVLQYTANQEKDFQKGVAGASTQAGHPVTAADVNPADDSRLNDITDFLEKTAGHAVSSVSDRGLSTHIETAPARRGISLLRERLRGLFHKR